jgi:glycosyltransferase involved in cell wall biosynthesis
MLRIVKLFIYRLKNDGLLAALRSVLRVIRNSLVHRITVYTGNLNKENVPEKYYFINPETLGPDKSDGNIGINRIEDRLLWIIPDFGVGSGGHLNLFRFAHYLQSMGLYSDFAVYCPDRDRAPREIAESVNKDYYRLDSGYYIIKKDDFNAGDLHYRTGIATSWETAYLLKNMPVCSKKAYFVQDYEPYFFPYGAKYVMARNTYDFGFYGITAGNWLKDKLEKEHNMKCVSFGFSYDRDLYKPDMTGHSHSGKRVFYYARPNTPRRGFELGMLVFEKLCRHHPDVEIIMAGGKLGNYEIPFKHESLGIVTVNELSDIYNKCDAALILSFTNLSLLPLELSACLCPVVINEGYNNSWIDPEKKLFVYSGADVESLYDNLRKVLYNDDYRKVILSSCSENLKNFSWRKEAERVFDFLKSL